MSASPRLAVVVGGASGIGAATVGLYRAEDIPVTVWDIAGAFDIHCDVSDPDSILRATEDTLDGVGVPDELTVTAGIGRAGMLLDEPVDAWDRVIAVNTRGPWLVMRAMARAMRDAGRPGSMVALSSISARLVDPTMGLYCASKAALSMLVHVAASEWGPIGIRVNAVGPGVTQTPMLGPAPTESGWLAGVRDRTPLGRLGQAEDIAAAVVAIHRLDWVTGQVVEVDGGLSMHSPINASGTRP